MSRFAIICSLVLAALAGVNSQAANWGSAAGNNTAQALANAIARATESAAVKIVSAENAVNNLAKGVNTTAISAAGVNPIIAAATTDVTSKVARYGNTFAFLSTTANNGSVVACPTDRLNGTVSANCTNAVTNLNGFAPSGAANAVVGGVSVQGLLAYVVVGNTVANKQAVVACDVNYLTGAFTGCVDSTAVFQGIAAVSPGLKGARMYAATKGPGAAAYNVGGAYKCDLNGKVISGCVQTAVPTTKFNGAAQIALSTRNQAYISNAGTTGTDANTIARCNVAPETGLLSNCTTALNAANAKAPFQIVERDGFVWFAQQNPNNAIAYATISPFSGDLSGTTTAVTGLPATSSFLAFGQGDRLYSASFTGKVTRCVYTFQALSKALGSTPYPPVVNQCKTATPSVAGAPVQPILGFAVGPSNY